MTNANTEQRAADKGFLDHLERVARRPLLPDAASVAVDVHDIQLAIQTIARLLDPGT